MRRSALAVAVALVLGQTCPGRVRADIMQYESLDQAVAGADLVVRGEVVELISQKLKNGIVWTRIKVKVAETIKGEKFDEVRFLIRESPLEPRPATWRNLRDEMLFCLNSLGGRVPEESPLIGDFVLRDGNLPWAIVLTGAPGTGPIYSLKFEELKKPEQILAAARAAAKDRGGKKGAMLEWILDGPRILRPHTVLYPDTERVRAAAKTHRIKLHGAN